MGKENNTILTALFFKASFDMVTSTETEFSPFRTPASIKASSKITIFKVLESLGMKMEIIMKVSGVPIRCKEKEFLPGKTGKSTLASFGMTRDMDMGLFTGQMARNTKGTGLMTIKKAKGL